MKLRDTWEIRFVAFIGHLVLFTLVILVLTGLLYMVFPEKLDGIVALFSFPWLLAFITTKRLHSDPDSVEFWSGEFCKTFVKLLLFLYFFLFVTVQLQHLEYYLRYGKTEKQVQEEYKWKMIDEYEKRSRKNPSGGQ